MSFGIAAVGSFAGAVGSMLGIGEGQSPAGLGTNVKSELGFWSLFSVLCLTSDSSVSDERFSWMVFWGSIAEAIAHH